MSSKTKFTCEVYRNEDGQLEMDTEMNAESERHGVFIALMVVNQLTDIILDSMICDDCVDKKYGGVQ